MTLCWLADEAVVGTSVRFRIVQKTTARISSTTAIVTKGNSTACAWATRAASRTSGDAVFGSGVGSELLRITAPPTQGARNVPSELNAWARVNRADSVLGSPRL